MPKCIFCQIAQKKVKTKSLYEDKNIIAFWDIKPATKIHIIIIPKRHFNSLNDVPESKAKLLGKMIIVAKNLAKKFKIDKSGYKLVINIGPDANQTVKHLHIHILGGQPLHTKKILEI